MTQRYSHLNAESFLSRSRSGSAEATALAAERPGCFLDSADERKPPLTVLDPTSAVGECGQAAATGWLGMGDRMVILPQLQSQDADTVLGPINPRPGINWRVSHRG